MFLKTNKFTAAELAAKKIEIERRLAAAEAELKTTKETRGSLALQGAAPEEINRKIREIEDTIDLLKDEAAEAEKLRNATQAAEGDIEMKKLWDEQRRLCGEIHEAAGSIATKIARAREIDREFSKLLSFSLANRREGEFLRLPLRAAYLGYKKAGGAQLSSQQFSSDYWRSLEQEVVSFVQHGTLAIGVDYSKRSVAQICDVASKMKAVESTTTSKPAVGAFSHLVDLAKQRLAAAS